MAETHHAQPIYALPGGQEGAIEAAFYVDPGDSGGCRVERIAVEHGQIRATYRGAQGELWTLIARRPEDAPSGSRRTAHFTLEGDLPEPLLACIERALRAGEGAIRWERTEDERGEASSEPHSDPRDAELLAFCAGVKPALRRALPDRGAASALAEQLEASGLHSCVSDGEQLLGQQLRFIVYGASSAKEAARLRSLDALSERVSTKATAHNNRALGKALGYPPCCVDAFIQRDRQLNSFLGQRLSVTPHYRYLGARRAWSAQSRWQLNPHLAAEGVFLVSFEPCSYVCPRALEVARATLDVVAERDPAAAEVMQARLRSVLAISRRGSIVRLEYEAGHTSSRPRLREARALSTHAGEAPGGSAQAAAEALRRRARRPEKPRPWDWWSPVVVDFDH